MWGWDDNNKDITYTSISDQWHNKHKHIAVVTFCISHWHRALKQISEVYKHVSLALL